MNEDDERDPEVVTDEDVDQLFREYEDARDHGTGEEADAAHERFAEADDKRVYGERVI